MKAVWIAGGLLAVVMSVAVADEPLNGVWVSNCFQFEPGTYQVRTFDFLPDQLATITTTSYTDASCQQVPTDSLTVSASWNLGEKLTTEEGVDAYTLDVFLKVGPRQELVSLKQIAHVQQGRLLLGINQLLHEYPQKLDWEIEYSTD
jgi:hypothetical protein